MLIDLNNRPFKKLPGCRRSAFESLDAPALRPLPAQRYAISRWKTAKVNIDYHVEFDGHYYSVPHRLVGAKIDVRVTGNLLECFASNQRVAGHAMSTVRGGFTTTPEHMPAKGPRRGLYVAHTARTWSGRRPSSSPGASASA